MRESDAMYCAAQMASFGDPVVALKWVEQQEFLPDIVILGRFEGSSIQLIRSAGQLQLLNVCPHDDL